MLLACKTKYKVIDIEKDRIILEVLKELISKVYRGEKVTKDEEWEVFFYLLHIPNIKKTDEEFELYCRMAKEKGIPKPDRNSYIRPLHEKL